jgi:hypothetical protein
MADQAPTTGVESPSGERHPGRIEFEDRVEGRTWTESPAKLTQTMAWAEVDSDRWLPVVRIVTDGVPGRLEIKRFGPDGGLLDVTAQRPPPPRRGV